MRRLDKIVQLDEAQRDQVFGITARGSPESRWFPGHTVPLRTLAFFAAVLLAGGIGFQALLEAKGGRVLGLAAIFLGAVPLMAGAVPGTISERMAPIAAWLIGLSPVSMPLDASGTLLSLADLPREIARAVPRAFYFWLFVGMLASGWLVVRLWTARRAIAHSALAGAEPK